MLQRHVPSCEFILLFSCNTSLATILSPRHVAWSSTCWTLWDMSQGQNVAGMRCPFVCTVVQHVPATKSTFQPITDNDQICSRSCIGKNHMTATDSGVRFWIVIEWEMLLMYYFFSWTCCCWTENLVRPCLLRWQERDEFQTIFKELEVEVRGSRRTNFSLSNVARNLYEKVHRSQRESV